MEQISCQNLAIGYEGRVLRRDINFSLQEGDYLCVLGENGSGKSTLLKTILGLQQPKGGTINLGEGVKSNEIGYLPQQTLVQRDFPASVREIVLSGCQNRVGFRPFYNRKEKERAKEMMDKLHISHLSHRSYRELSGGQQQRVLLARALCATQKILLLDEPVSGLDPRGMEEMYELMEQINHKDKISILMISHDLDKAVDYASHILYLGEKTLYMTKEAYQKEAHWIKRKKVCI